MSEEIPSKTEYVQIADEIRKMCDADQAMRLSAMERGGIIENEEDGNIDIKHTERMKEIVQLIGWPTVSKVGEDVSVMAWLLVQHADHDVEFQKKCLNLMKTQPEGEVSKRNIAYLEDRVRVNENRPQLYGTQFRGDTKETYGPKPIENPEHVDERRKEVGMESLEEYKQMLLNKFFSDK